MSDTDNQNKVIAIGDPEFQLDRQLDWEFNYQKDLTVQLDQAPEEVDQHWINEVVLWKVNRYAKPAQNTIDLLNQINPTATAVDHQLTRSVLNALLETKGIQLPMASSILRFRNPQIYQIIDQRVFRVLYPGKVLKTSQYNSAKNREEQIEMYIQYLEDLRLACESLEIEFELADRVLYMADKRLNKSISLSNYGSRKA